MSIHVNIVKEFYEALSTGDFHAIQSFYSPEATYQDEIVTLKGNEVFSHWFMMCREDFKTKAELIEIKENQNIVTTKWTIDYLLVPTGRRIFLEEEGYFYFNDGVIAAHRDKFDIYSFTKQGFGMLGYLIGWTSWAQNRLRKQAKKTILTHIYEANKNNLRL